jgi:hypothetical protein
MSTPSSDHIVDPPIVDHLWFDVAQNSYVVTFVPDAEVSSEATEVVVISAASPEGRIITAHMRALADVLASLPSRIVHSGEGDFALHMPDGTVVQLSDSRFDTGVAVGVYDELKSIAEAAQCAFRIAALANR